MIVNGVDTRIIGVRNLNNRPIVVPRGPASSRAVPRAHHPILGFPDTPNPPPSAPPLVFWYHRYEGVGVSPLFLAETAAVAKGMIPIINIANSTYSWGSTYETAALAFQTANGGCKIALSQAFWGQTADADDAWDTAGVWLDYITKRQADADNLIMMIDVEPPGGLSSYVNTVVAGRYGIAGTAEQVAAAEAFVAAATKFQFALPDLRNVSPYIVPTTPGSFYAILPGLGTRRINEATYAPGGSYTTISVNDVIGLRVSTDGRNYSYTPELAKVAFPGWDRMYFNIETTDEAKLEIVGRL